jgi:hypothetical protein
LSEGVCVDAFVVDQHGKELDYEHAAAEAVCLLWVVDCDFAEWLVVMQKLEVRSLLNILEPVRECRFAPAALAEGVDEDEDAGWNVDVNRHPVIGGRHRTVHAIVLAEHSLVQLARAILNKRCGVGVAQQVVRLVRERLQVGLNVVATEPVC